MENIPYESNENYQDPGMLNAQYEIEKDFFKMDFKYNGPQDQLVYILRFPISYKNSQLINQRVSFPNYFDWMGQVREYSLRPLIGEIIKLTEGRKWGLATNAVSLRVFDLLKADDVLEVRLWLDKITGLDNIYHLSFDWLRFLGTNLYERVALSDIIVSCVKVVSHGNAVIAKPPVFLKTFFDAMKPQSVEKRPLNTYRTLLENIDSGVRIKDYGKNPLFIFENFYQTSLEHSNLIGNVYFSNYSKWIDSTKDLFLYQRKPELFNPFNSIGEFITSECAVSYLQEAMPFDKISIRMYLAELYEKRIIFKYELFKVQDGSRNVKLAVVTQDLIFVSCHMDILEIKEIPVEILHDFLDK